MTILVAYQNLPPVLMHKEEGEEVSRFFLHDRAQPFIVSLFQCVIVFKKICKWLRGKEATRRQEMLWNNQQFQKSIIRFIS